MRHYRGRDQLLAHPAPKVLTVHEVLLHAAKTHGANPMLGARKLVKVHEETKEVVKIVAGKEVREKKTWQFSELGPYSWSSAQELLQRATAIGSGLVGLGYKKGDKACIYAPTGIDWQASAHGCWTQGMVIATAYDTLGTSGLLHSLNEPSIPVIFMHASLFPTLTAIVRETTHLRHVIHYGTPTSPKHADELLAAGASRGIQLISLDQLTARGTTNPVPTNPPANADLCCIMYTSGSTGAPKGVMISHGNIVAALGGVQATLNGVLTDKDTYMAFLPLAHILELVVESYCLYVGTRLGYGTVRTLTDASVRNCRGDIAELRPTIMCGVPAVWDTIKKGVLAQIAKQPPLVQRIFWLMYKLKQFSLLHALPFGWIADAVAFKKVRAATGGKLRIALSGGAPISADSQLFLSTVLCPVVQGYGMTESIGMAALYTPELAFSTNNVGAPVPCVEMQLVDVPEAGYTTSRAPMQGEIWVRGPAVCMGYFNQPAMTKEVFTEDGWLMTGDIGEFMPSGQVKIIDRKKNLIKLSNGEYIALERLESVYAGSKYVARLAVYADSERSYPIAIVQPVPAAVEAAAKANGIAFDSWEQLCHQKVIAAAVLDDLKAIAKSNKFAAAEVVQAVVLADEEWTPINDMLTAAMKLQRRNIIKHYKSEIERVYV
ncbi:long-chain-fatty-acid-CoA ligase 1 [Blastocladiella britannica]|nr:long-chain-fatty-acid-CoA ligase 1 [Blastocladiella britannica]